MVSVDKDMSLKHVKNSNIRIMRFILTVVAIGCLLLILLIHKQTTRLLSLL